MIPFLDLRRQTKEVESDLRAALDAVLAESRFIGGDAVAAFERDFAAFCGARHCVGVGSGTNAITIALRAVGVRRGDEVITAANTCVATVAGIAAAGAVPVLADVDPHTLTLAPESAAAAMTRRTRAIVPVHLYGRCADVASLGQLGVRIVEDAAQAHGSAEVLDVAAFSFYPTKNLGALGDGGAIVTSDDDVAAAAGRLRTYGDTVERPYQSRLDTVQAAVLRAKLPYLADWNARRRRLAARYDKGLTDSPVALPADGDRHVYHLYVVRSPGRDALQARLAERGVETLAHYPLAVHAQPAWSELARPGLAESERAAAEVLSLPLYPQLRDTEADAVIDAVRAG